MSPVPYWLQQALAPDGSQNADAEQSACVAHWVLQVAVPLQPKLFGQILATQAPVAPQLPLQLLVVGSGGQSAAQQFTSQRPDWHAESASLVTVAEQGFPDRSLNAQSCAAQ